MKIAQIILILIWIFFILKYFLYDLKNNNIENYLLIFKTTNYKLFFYKSFFLKSNILFFILLYLIIFLELGFVYMIIGIVVEFIVKSKILKTMR